MKSLIIDNYDSFTYNLFQLWAEITGVEPVVVKNNETTWAKIKAEQFDNIIISPGPGHPDDAQDFGICSEVICKAEVPIFGVCLGHQGIYSAFGGKVVEADEPMHGRISVVHHQGASLFQGIPPAFRVVRYHSLMASRAHPANDLIVIAKTTAHEIMALQHKTRPIWGVQFHPESIGSEYGLQLLANFRDVTVQRTPLMPIKPLPKVTTTSCHRLFVEALSTYYDPLQVYQALYRDKKNSVWLDSSKTDASARFSFMGCADGPLSFHFSYSVTTKEITLEKQGIISHHAKPLWDFLRTVLAEHAIEKNTLPFDFQCGLVGYLGYELKSETMQVQNQHHSTVPDAQFIFLDRLLVFDHQEKKTYLVALTEENRSWLTDTRQALASMPEKFVPELKPQALSAPRWCREKQGYLDDIDACLAYLKSGDTYEVCLTNQIQWQGQLDAYTVHYYLRHINPTPYAALLQFLDVAVASSSMECFLKIDANGLVKTKPIKGTLPRGKTKAEDAANITALQTNEKFRAENLMIVDLLRNDLAKVSVVGSVSVPTLMQVETYQSLHQLVSTVQSQLKPENTAVDCLQATFPGGSMTGAPKRRTLEIIDSLEKTARGIYSGAIGYLSLNGAADFNIVIRTAVMSATDVTVGVGGAIISLSDKEEEYAEICLKARALEQALAAASKSIDKVSETHHNPDFS